MTGSANGIGRALCHARAKAGARVVAADMDGARASEIVSATDGVPVAVDVTVNRGAAARGDRGEEGQADRHLFAM